MKRIAWLQDDSGFISCGQDAVIYYWKLYPKRDDNSDEQNPIWSFRHQKISFSSVAVFKSVEEADPVVYATGSDRSIREISKAGESLRYEENLTYS